MTQKVPAEKNHCASSNTSFKGVLPWIFFASLVYVTNYLTRAFFGPLLPGIEDDFSINHATSTRFLLYISIGYTSSMLLSGPACAKIRPRILAAGSLVLSGLVFQAMAVMHNLLALSVLFIIFGFAAGQYFNAGMSVLRSLVRPSQWSKAVSIHEFGPNIGFILAPLAAEFGSVHLGWRGTVSCLGWLSIAIGLLFLSFGKGGNEPVGGSVSWRSLTSVAGNRRLWLFAWFIGLSIAGQFAPFSVLTMHMIEERSLTPDFAAFLLSASRLATPIGALIGGILTTSMGTRKTLFICFSVYAISMFALGAPILEMFIAGLFIQPLFTAMLFSPLFTMLAETFPTKRQPLAIGLGVPVGSFFGIGLMPGALGLFGDHASFAAGFIAMGGIVAASIVLLRFAPIPACRPC